MPCHWFLQRQIFTPFFFSFAWDCTEGTEMDYLGLQLHNIQREEQLESEIEEMKRHQRDQLDLPAILYNFVCCPQNISRDDAAGGLWLPLRVHSLSCSIIISCFCPLSPHHISLWSSLCLCDAESLGKGLPLGPLCPQLGQLHHSHSWAPVILPQKCSENQNSFMGDATKTTLSHSLQLPLNFCLLCFFWH